MGSRVRFTVAGVVSLAAAVGPLVALSACDHGPMYDPAYPIEGGPTERPTKDPPDVVVPPDAPVEAGTCNVMGTQIDVRNVPEDPNNFPIGGAIADGTYKLTGAVYFNPSGDGGIVFKRTAFMQFAGKNVTWQFDTNGEGKPEPKCCVGTWAFNNTEILSMNMTCNGEEEVFGEIYDFHPNGIPADGGADGGDAGDGGAAQIMIHVGALHDIYTKQ